MLEAYLEPLTLTQFVRTGMRFSCGNKSDSDSHWVHSRNDDSQCRSARASHNVEQIDSARRTVYR